MEAVQVLHDAIQKIKRIDFCPIFISSFPQILGCMAVSVVHIFSWLRQLLMHFCSPPSFFFLDLFCFAGLLSLIAQRASRTHQVDFLHSSHRCETIVLHSSAMPRMNACVNKIHACARESKLRQRHARGKSTKVFAIGFKYVPSHRARYVCICSSRIPFSQQQLASPWIALSGFEGEKNMHTHISNKLLRARRQYFIGEMKRAQRVTHK